MMESFVELLTRAAKQTTKDCTVDTCPVSASVYGYYPNKPVTLILIVLFGISMILHIYQAIKSRSWTFLVALGVGCFGESVGYVGRLLLRNDPWSRAYLGIQLVCLTVSPAFIAGGIYLTLKHVIIIYGSRFSRIAPRLYTWIFVSCDILSILIQTSGAVIASRGTGKVSTGNNVMMLGLVLQVVTLAIFGLMAGDVYFRIKKFSGQHNEANRTLRHSKRFKWLLISILVSYIAIFLRCIYRIAEMAGGWRNPIMQDEVSFIILDGVLCWIAVLVLNVFHPGFLFKESYATIQIEKDAQSETPTEAPVESVPMATKA
ncbi:RTA1 like protein-domain-containing protein [Leptodontidium sp. 2 PMI_412]|nr:RTA1 like protein-domain-containing protein [Leptodontidium sp. 2 PMI_412]